ncbi:MAG: hypothetical protein M1816_006339 [Peltula sp. TS41687]|nr:MAG: hypothetical protein M1816_006339 [Peltula sp. TS41687]
MQSPTAPPLPPLPSNFGNLPARTQASWRMIYRLESRAIPEIPCSRCRKRVEEFNEDVICMASRTGIPSKLCVECILRHTRCDVARLEDNTLVTAVMPTVQAPTASVQTDMSSSAAGLLGGGGAGGPSGIASGGNVPAGPPVPKPLLPTFLELYRRRPDPPSPATPYIPRFPPGASALSLIPVFVPPPMPAHLSASPAGPQNREIRETQQTVVQALDGEKRDLQEQLQQAKRDFDRLQAVLETQTRQLTELMEAVDKKLAEIEREQ